jgi:hypothetical protein
MVESEDWNLCFIQRQINIWGSFHNHKLRRFSTQRVQCIYGGVFGFNFARDGKPSDLNSSVKRRRVWCTQRVQRLDEGVSGLYASQQAAGV